jgi:GH18 family chitinase
MIKGWNMGSADFSSMVNDNARRKNFVKTTVDFLTKYKFDGLGNLFIQNILSIITNF